MADFATIEEALDALRAGKNILVIDDPDRENEGDIICAAQFATTENVNFMATYAKGLICMPMSGEYCDKLGLPPMVEQNTDNHETAFTVAIDHVNTTTGISAEERGYTARATVLANAKPSDFRRPGHMFPLRAREGGVLIRSGHTEATVDLCRLAILEPVGLCCEIMREDGTMMRTTELIEFAKEHNLVMISIADLIAYRMRDKDEALVEEVACADMPTKFGHFKIHGFINKVSGEHHVALTMGDIANGEPVLCRVHSECLTGDTFGSKRCDCGEQLAASLKAINEEGRGLLLYLRQEGRGIGLMEKMKAYKLQEEGMDTVDANLCLGHQADERDYGVGAQILREIGVQKMRLLTNNPVKRVGLEAYGLEIVENVPIEVTPNPYNERYLLTKKMRMGHTLHFNNK